MKKKIQLFVLSILVTGFCLAQTEPSDFTGRDLRERERARQTDAMNFVPNEILVKFKDDVSLTFGTQLKSTGISGIDKLLKSANVVSMEKLFPQAQKLKSAQMLRLPNGNEMAQPNLHNIYKITLPELKSNQPNPVNVHEYIQQLQQQPEVEYVEPNYIYSIGDFTPASPEMTMLEAMEQAANDNVAENASGLIPNDPLYNSQWGIPACNIDDVWNTTTGDSTAIIAILDTGVDDEHPDLKKNIWKNKNEIPGNGRDDDGNGKIDDTWGWDFINNDNSPKDDNSHGTHVAGLAAAVGNNGIGISGVNWRAKIMPVKVFQSSGRGDAAIIAQGVTYAINKGASVLNMSFGSYSESITLKNALANAYATAVLVAAAGNDKKCIGPGSGCARMFPAAYSFVLGVEASNAGFSNIDQDGPAYSLYPDLENYELKAPGTTILSSVPGGNYREYNGTSMAAPLVAGAVSLYRKLKPTESQELLFGNFINSIDQHIDLHAALNIIPKPKLQIVSYELQDTIDGDRDGRPDAGETIEIKVKVRNTWGLANDVKVGIEFGEFEDQSTAAILNPEANVGSVSAYALTYNEVSLKIKIDNKLPNNRDIVFNLKTWYGNKLGLVQQQIILNVENGIELTGVLSNTKVLTPDKFWMISGSFKIAPTGILILKPGTHLLIKSSLINEGTIIGIGKPDSLIFITGTSIQAASEEGNINLKYCNVELNDLYWSLYRQFGSIEFSQISLQVNTFDLSIKDCIFYNSYPLYGGKFIRSNFDFVNDGCFSYGSIEIKYCNFVHTNAINMTWGQFQDIPNFQTGNNILIGHNSPSLYAEVGYNIDIPNQYWGTNNSDFIEQKLYDFNEDARLAKINFRPYLNQPSDSAHAIVWKVLVNGKDAQDEVVDPVGVGKQRFDVYFNRPMNKTKVPQVSFGIRFPYNQQMVNEDGAWSADGRIYTTYKTIQLTTGDGINRIRVSGAKEVKGWDFEIPVEDQRFEFPISAAASASADFQATPGLGKVALEWNNNDLEDGLGFNMYRMEQVNDTAVSKPVMINSSLIIDTVYTDFAVKPNKKYFYYYKILRTSLTETDSSKIVAAIPFTAALGDANGDLSVNVLDVTTIVAYLLNQNPQPFIFGAADVNGDKTINVLDIVATVNKVLNPGKSAGFVEAGTVNLYLQNDTLFADAPVPVGAIQFDVTNVSGMEEIEKLTALQGFESGYSVKDNTLRMIVYSLTGKTIPVGNRIPLLRMKKGSGITNMIMGDKTGSPLAVNYLSTGLWNLHELGNEVASLGQNYPNPFDKTTTIPVMINEPVDELVVRIINITGQEVAILPLKNPVLGENLLHWKTNVHKGMLVYRLEIMREGKMAVAGVKKMIVQ
jgi:subtilisin family serine protease